MRPVRCALLPAFVGAGQYRWLVGVAPEQADEGETQHGDAYGLVGVDDQAHALFGPVVDEPDQHQVDADEQRNEPVQGHGGAGVLVDWGRWCHGERFIRW